MTTTIELDAETAARIEALAVRTGQDKAAILRLLIENVIEDLEDAAAGDEVWDRVVHGKERIYTDAEMRAELGLDN